MDESIKDALQKYYALKGKYELSIQKKKQKIISDKTLNKDEKKKRWMNVKKKCVSCNGEGGTIFKNDKNMLIAVCNANKPCSLNIKIDRGHFSNIRDKYFMIKSEVQRLQNMIIETKLKVLFGYFNEDDAVKSFNQLRKHLAGFMKAHDKIQKEYLEIVHNGSTMKEKNDTAIELHNLIVELKKISESYTIEQKDGYITSMIELYIDKITPLVNKIRDITYKTNFMESIEGNGVDIKSYIRLVQEPYRMNDMYLADEGKDPRIIRM